jgi:hypothetical protein
MERASSWSRRFRLPFVSDSVPRIPLFKPHTEPRLSGSDGPVAVSHRLVNECSITLSTGHLTRMILSEESL